ncbi:MCM DNA helicase complex subunit [Metarhizium acridum]|nr:MCM DNA helicase complex subunit [Metarhizium acridum]
MTDSQSTQAHAATPSSPLRQMSESQTPRDDPQRTPRASGNFAGESSPIRYEPSSSPGRSLGLRSELRSESSGLFVGSERGSSAAYRRGDINSDALRTPRAPRRIILDDTGRVVQEGQTPGSDAASFANRDPNTSEADVLGGQGQSLIWGTTVSIDDTFAAFKDFLRHFTQKYRMYRDGFQMQRCRPRQMRSPNPT